VLFRLDLRPNLGVCFPSNQSPLCDQLAGSGTSSWGSAPFALFILHVAQMLYYVLTCNMNIHFALWPTSQPIIGRRCHFSGISSFFRCRWYFYCTAGLGSAIFLNSAERVAWKFAQDFAYSLVKLMDFPAKGRVLFFVAINCPWILGVCVIF